MCEAKLNLGIALIYNRVNPSLSPHGPPAMFTRIALMILAASGLLPPAVPWVSTCRAFALPQEPPAPAVDTPKQQPEPEPRRANRLSRETSPYLLQHAHNPVDWYPWGPEAFEVARTEQKPIFLSVGYSTCYWCHVMERESFESEEIARYLNEHFICIKVDREERPDVDQIYMAAVQAFSGRGGWPMSVFCLPDSRPFFGGTYFPVQAREGMETFPSLLERVVTAWRDHRPALEADAEKVSSIVRRSLAATDAATRAPLSLAMIERGVSALAEQFDVEHGGFGFDTENFRRPKFPEPANLLFLLDQHRRRARSGAREAAGTPQAADSLAMVEKTLDHMSRGGIRDHLGGGYHRYSTDRAWAVPHFEKMLYDNALLALVFLDTYEQTKNPRWAAEARAIFEFIDRELTSPGGAFYSALDAEVDGREGDPYVWTKTEVNSILGQGEDAALFARVYGLTNPANFEEDRHVLLLPRPLAETANDLGVTPEMLDQRLRPLRARLLEARRKKPQPWLDDKILTAWNGLMIAAYAEGFRVLGDEAYRRAAEGAADFLGANLRTPEGRLLRTWRADKAKVPAYLDDHAFLAFGLLRVFKATGDGARLDQATKLADQMVASFADERAGGFFFTAGDHESLLARPKEPYDGALPSGNAIAVLTLLELAEATGRPELLDVAARALNALSPALSRTPAGVPMLLAALARYRDLRPDDVSDSNDQAVQAGIRDPLGIGNPEHLVKAEAALDVNAAPIAGSTVLAHLTLTIAEGWHLTANPSGRPSLKPTTVKLLPSSEITLEPVTYPEGALRKLVGGEEPVPVYEGRIQIPIMLRLGSDLPSGNREVKLQIRFQACNDRACLAPATLAVPLSIDVSRP
jgi:uncharacterized protein YyaL (SSP411 family)